MSTQAKPVSSSALPSAVSMSAAATATPGLTDYQAK